MNHNYTAMTEIVLREKKYRKRIIIPENNGLQCEECGDRHR